ncbi:MAG: putative colanic acid biosynthesis acetyltransferase [Rikenellaceae bacterium]
MYIEKYTEPKPHHLKRVCWFFINATIFRWFAGGLQFRYIRNFMLRMFGAKIPADCLIYSSCKIWAPWNLEIGEKCCVGPNTQLYNKAPIIIKNYVVVSQGSFLCTASHDISDPRLSLITAPIILEDKSWVASDAFVGMGVTIGEGAVVGARSAVFKSVEPWSVVGGNPAKFIKKRVLKDE